MKKLKKNISLTELAHRYNSEMRPFPALSKMIKTAMHCNKEALGECCDQMESGFDGKTK